MGKKPTSRTLALYLERILLEYTDANKDMYLRLSDIQQLLRTVYNITVDDGQPRQTLKIWPKSAISRLVMIITIGAVA